MVPDEPGLIRGDRFLACELFCQREGRGKQGARKEQYAEAAEQLGEATKSKGIDAATAFTIEMLGNLERVIEHPDMTEELAEILSTGTVTLTYEVNTGIDIADE